MTRVRPDVIVTWLQNDYGQLGRAAESIAHSLQDSGMARQVVYMEPWVPGPDRATIMVDDIRGLHLYRFHGQPADACEVAEAVMRNSQLCDPILLNFGVDTANWWFHGAFAPVARTTALITHDILSLWPGVDPTRGRSLQRLRSLLVRGSDHVIGLSAGSIADVTGAVYVGHGCDPGMEDPQVEALPEPPDLAAIPHPRALYFGALSYRIDVRAVAALADSGVHVVLVGFAPSPQMASLIESHQRVHFLGPRAPGVSRAYLRHCDVGIVPHTDEPFTWTMEPHKVYNYSCAGIRTVLLNCSAPPALEPILSTTRTVEEFVSACHIQLSAGRLNQSQRASARELTWTSVSRKILSVVSAGTSYEDHDSEALIGAGA